MSEKLSHDSTPARLKKIAKLNNYDLAREYFRVRDNGHIEESYRDIVSAELDKRQIPKTSDSLKQLIKSEPFKIKIKEAIKGNSWLFFTWLRGFIILNIMLILSEGSNVYKNNLIDEILLHQAGAVLMAFPAGFVALIMFYFVSAHISLITDEVKAKRYIDALLTLIWLIVILMAW